MSFKKVFSAIILIFSLSAAAFSNEFFYELTLYAIKGSCSLENPEKYYVPQKVKDFYNRNVEHNGKFIPLLEKLFPEKTGLLEGSGFYICEEDSGEWIEQIIYQVEEEKIGEAITKMEDDSSSGLYVPEEDYDTLVEQNYVNSDSELFYQEFGSEIFMPKKVEDGKSIILIANSKEIKRLFYDQSYKIIKKEFWSNETSPVTKLRTEDYEYEEDSSNPVSKTITDKDSRRRYFYNEDGLPYQLKIYLLKDNKYLLNSSTNYVYDSEKRVIKQEEKDYVYTNSRITDTFVKKHIFMYKSEDVPADEDYYENDVLKMRTRNSKRKGTYWQQIFFDENFSVKTYYEDDIKVREEFDTDGKIRVKNYAK